MLRLLPLDPVPHHRFVQLPPMAWIHCKYGHVPIDLDRCNPTSKALWILLVKYSLVVTCWQGVISKAVIRVGFNIFWLLSTPTPQQQNHLFPNVKTYTKDGRYITFEELPCFKLGYNLWFHVHLRIVFQWHKWFGHLLAFGDEGGMARGRKNLKNAVGGWLWEDQPQSALRL